MIEASEVWATSLIDQISKVCHLVISLSTVSQIHAIRTFTSEAFRKLTKECPLSLYYPQYPVLKLDFIHMWCELRLWNCGALNKMKGFISKCTLVESKSGRKRFNFLDDFPSKLKCSSAHSLLVWTNHQRRRLDFHLGLILCCRVWAARGDRS